MRAEEAQPVVRRGELLSPEQIAFYEAFGFLVFRQLFSAEEMVVIDAEFEAVMVEDLAGQPFRGDKRYGVGGWVERRPALRSLIDDDRIYEPVEQLLGPEPMWWGSDGNYYVGDTQWHPDATEFVTGRRFKVALYLDPVTRETGCLRFIPGSHRQPLHGELEVLRISRVKQNIADGVIGPEALDPYREQGIDVEQLAFGVRPEGLPAYAVESRPGDVVLFDHHLYHGSFGGHVGRRMFTLNYYTAPQTAAAAAVFQREWDSYGDSVQARLHEDAVLWSDRPRLQRLVAPLFKWGWTPGAGRKAG